MNSEADVELVRRGLGAFSRGDFDEALTRIHPEVEWHVTLRLPDLPPDKLVFEGRDEVRELWDKLTGVFDSIAIEVEEVIAQRPGAVVARARFRGRGTGSGVEVDRVVFYVFGIDDGLLRSIRPFDSEAEALAASGLEHDA